MPRRRMGEEKTSEKKESGKRVCRFEFHGNVMRGILFFRFVAPKPDGRDNARWVRHSRANEKDSTGEQRARRWRKQAGKTSIPD